MPGHEVTSELYSEHDYQTSLTPTRSGNAVSHFPFVNSNEETSQDDDLGGDLILSRPIRDYIQIEHARSTSLSHVALQVWRGSLLLADLMLEWGRQGRLRGATILELGAGTGVTSIVASMFADTVLCTDLNVDGVLDLITINKNRNSHLTRSQFVIAELDFTKEEWSSQVKMLLPEVSLILAADVIYDDDVTAAFMTTLQRLLNTSPDKTVVIALEKRFVFTIENLDSVAPCYETFLSLLDKLQSNTLKFRWRVEQMTLDFPQYFTYDRVKELVLWKITSTAC